MTEGERVPESIDDPAFGPLRWDERLGWWTGSVELAPGHRVEVQVDHAPGVEQIAEEVAAARECLARVREREAEYRRCSAAELSTKRWNTDEPMTPADIENLLRVASLYLRPDGSARIYWDDGDALFWGNNLFTEVGPDGAYVTARME